MVEDLPAVFRAANGGKVSYLNRSRPTIVSIFFQEFQYMDNPQDTYTTQHKPDSFPHSAIYQSDFHPNATDDQKTLLAKYGLQPPFDSTVAYSMISIVALLLIASVPSPSLEKAPYEHDPA